MKVSLNLSRKFNRKIVIKWLGLALLAITAVFAGTLLYEKLTLPVPEEALRQSLPKTLNTQSCRYQAVAVRVLDGQETVISEVSGEKNLQSVHIKGNLPIVKSEVEVYQFPDAMYRRDSLTKGWLVVPAKGRAAMEQLISEINPMGAFHFDDAIEVLYAGKEKVGKYSCRIYEVIGRGQNKYLELYWQDFNYRLWVDRKEGYIRKAEIMAEHRDNSQHLLKLTMTLSDYNEVIEIKPPAL